MHNPRHKAVAASFGIANDTGKAMPCPCGSGLDYSRCCGVFHNDIAAPTPEALMRSRYSAFALNLSDYLLATWHLDTRPGDIEPDDATNWISLRILDHTTEGDHGRVHFRATFSEGQHWSVLEEDSRFVREEGRWLYVNGSPRIERLKPRRNEACPCESGRKYKACCGR